VNDAYAKLHVPCYMEGLDKSALSFFVASCSWK
jgi:hypothetical protein